MDKSIIVGTGIILLDENRRVLLVKDAKEKRGGAKDKWGIIIGGMQEAYLNFEDNAVKEALEETGFEIKLEKLVGVYQSVEDEYNRISIIFLATPIGIKSSYEDEEISAIKWFDYGEIPWDDMRFSHNKTMLQDAYRDCYPLNFIKYI
jgi:ADP-ribose pyrophosphatase YjhB (NUDIX family)